MMLSNKSLTEDLLTYGYVVNANSLKLKVILPSGFIGLVDPTQVSKAYTTMLKNLVNSENNAESQEATNLQSLFPVGSFIVCKVMNTKSTPIKLSLNPKDINQNIYASQIKSNMILMGSIKSIEDHGYVIDLGIANISAFLCNTNAAEYISIFNNDKTLQIGQQLRCLIVSKPKQHCNEEKNESRIVQVTIDPFQIDSAVMKPSMNLSYASIQPGLKAEVKIVKISSHCLNVTFQNYEGMIPKVFWDLSEKKFKKDTVIEATLVCVDHKQKFLIFSLLNHYHNPVSDLFPNYKEGQRKLGIVQSVNPKIGIYFGLPKGILGLADLQGLSGKGSSSIEEAYVAGSEHKCRVIGFLPIENTVQVSVKSIQNDTKFLTIKDIIPGDLVTCHVKKFLEHGVLVSINERLAGVIPSYHVDDDTTKAPEELLGEGDEVKCQILSTDLKSHKIFLTSKKSLLESKFPIVFRFDQLKEEMLIDGHIKLINDVGVLLAFYGDLTVWLPKKCFHLASAVSLLAAFKLGQVIKCRVSKLIPEEEKIFLILPDYMKEIETQSVPDDTPNPGPMKTIRKLRKVQKAAITAPKVGNLTKCVLHKKTDKSFNVFLIPSNKSALIPKMHLSDSEEMCEKIWDNYEPGYILDVVIFEKKNDFIIASNKTSLVRSAMTRNIVTSFKDLKVGQVLFGVVQNVVDYGVFVEFPGHTVGLARNKFITDESNLVIDYWFKPGLTVQAKVTEINKKRETFCVSLLKEDVGFDQNYKQKILGRIFKDEADFDEIMKKQEDQKLLKDLEVGTLCQVIITEVNEHGVLCILKNGGNGFVAIQHAKGQKLRKGLETDALIIDIDYASNCVQLCLSTRILLYAKKIQNQTQWIHAGGRMKSLVLLNKPGYVLLMLLTHMPGQLAYLCSKIHENDITSCDRFCVNEQLKVEFLKKMDKKIIVRLHSTDKKFPKMQFPQSIKKTTTETAKEITALDKENIVEGEQEVDSAKSHLELNSSPTTKAEKGKKRKSGEAINDKKSAKKSKKKKCKEMNEDDDEESEVKDKVVDVMPPIFFDWDETPKVQNSHCEDDSEDDMIEDEIDCTNSKKSKTKLKENKEKEEQRLYEIERKYLEGEKHLETAEDFDCLVLNSPNSSLLWLRYMAFHLETAEIDKARAVAERALKTISFREEQEKFNIWAGYLNLENLYGTKEKLAKVLERALQQNQPIKVYQQLVNIYTKSGKIQEAEDLHHILLKRFRSEKSIWINYAVFCYKNACLEEGRKLVERAVKSLDKKDHVSLIVKIAQLEFKYGETERGKTMFENIVGNFPKRTDLWSIYIDMTIQEQDKDDARNLFERVTNLRLSTHKMKFFFKKYLDFEQKYGTPELVMGVRKKALEYVEDSHETESGTKA